jgi:hypothetical protein
MIELEYDYSNSWYIKPNASGLNRYSMTSTKDMRMA